MKRKGLAKNRLLIGMFGLLIVAFFLTTARAQQAPEKRSPTPPGVTQLLLNTFFPPTHTQVTQVLQPWMQEVERRTEGRVR